MSRRVFAVRYAHREARRAEHFYGPEPPDPHDAPMAMDYFLWAIAGDGPPVVVDAGFTADTAKRRGREIVADPIAVLAELGVDAAEVRDVVLTHLHYDHSGHLAAFPKARFWVQESELQFWTGRHAARGEIGPIVEPPDIVELVRLNFERRVRFLSGDEPMADGVGLHFSAATRRGCRSSPWPPTKGRSSSPPTRRTSTRTSSSTAPSRSSTRCRGCTTRSTASARWPAATTADRPRARPARARALRRPARRPRRGRGRDRPAWVGFPPWRRPGSSAWSSRVAKASASRR